MRAHKKLSVGDNNALMVKVVATEMVNAVYTGDIELKSS
jgi:hypothetical protein